MAKEQVSTIDAELEKKKKDARSKHSTEPKKMIIGSGGAMVPVEEVDADEIAAIRLKEKEESSN